MWAGNLGAHQRGRASLDDRLTEAPHERFRCAGPSENISFCETYDIGYVRDKLPKLKPDFAEILGQAITRHHQFLKYREAHHAKVSAGLETLVRDRQRPGSATVTGRTEIVPMTVASSLPDDLKTLTHIDLRTSVFDEDRGSGTGFSKPHMLHPLAS
ncbi:hypothetical protein N657DRAFT_317409 [Parathielavia appendiculata]|uniref:Uncharacterized protein n=1 Tax=Parathielavia appendiculata TaxID=2587402 RepID=A0AAN6TR72_9PEZI|nr:hypothetical protein N657DRAFT_317409 [Parathielavia appendiculata]